MAKSHFLCLPLLLLIAVPSTAILPAPIAARQAAAVASSGFHTDRPDGGQQEKPGRGDDLGRIRAWRAFLTSADRAFFAARMNTAAVRSKTEEADARIEELEKAAESSEPDAAGRSDITGDVAFLERAFRAFTAAHLSTTEVQKWLAEARDKD